MRTYKRNTKGLGNIAELAPALMIGLAVLFFFISVAFVVSGIVTANYACQFSAREGATGGSRSSCIAAATNAARAVAEGPFGAFAGLKANDGSPFADKLKISFLEVKTDGTTTEVLSNTVIDTSLNYQIRIEAPYRITVPFAGNIPGVAASECYVDNAEALAIN